MIKFYICDLETSGLKKKFNEVTEISIIRVDDRMQLFRKVKCKYPERANIDALRITNKTLNDLRQGHNSEDVINEVEKFFGEDNLTPSHRCLVGHNIWNFDRLFLHAMWENINKQFPVNLYLDTLSLMKDYIKKNELGKQKTNLSASCDLLQIKKTGSQHNAKDDCKNNYFLYQALLKSNINYLPFIKTSIHKINEEDDLELLNE